MENSVFFGILFILVGAVSRILVPWLVKLYTNNAQWKDWDWSYLRGQLILVGIFVLAMPVLVQNFPDVISGGDWYGAWMAGWFAADLGRELDKLREG